MAMSSAPTISKLDFGDPNPEHFVHIIENLLSEEECTSLIKAHTNLEFSDIPTGTIRARELFHDEKLAARLYSRISDFYVGDRIRDKDGHWWRVKGLSPRLRLSRYEKGGQFAPHFDYRRLASIDEQSFMSVNIYLNTVPKLFKGATRILQHLPGDDLYWDGWTPLTVLAKIQPVMGMASIFGDTLWHDGEELIDGEKYLLRTDVMYEREREFDFEKTYGHLSKERQAKKAVDIAYQLEEGGNNREAEMWFQKAFELRPGIA